MSSLRNIAIIGPTPTLGSYILTSLLRNPNFKITIITRASSPSIFLPHPSQTIIKVPDTYPESELIAALKNQDALVINLPVSHTATTQLKIIDAAVNAGVKRIIPSDFAGCVPLEKTQELDFMTRDNATVVEYLRSKEKDDLSWSAVKCGLYLDYQLEVPWFCFDLKAQKVQLWDDGEAKFATSTREKIGDAVVAVLTHLEETKNKIVYANSFTTSQKQLMGALEKATGKSWEVERLSSADEISAGKEMLKNGNMMGIGAIVKSICFTKGWGADFEGEDVEAMSEVLGLEEEDLDEVVSKIVQEFGRSLA
ncbi:isoflavone reductase family protein-like protein [Stipitochalara longipes BDJ]|nr:isoflavone reductase family protein-like protein [Stipitochalara longipes BDJ]